MEIHISASEGSKEQQQMLYCNTDFSKALSDQPRIRNSCCFLCSAAVYHPAQSWQPHWAAELKQSGIPVESFIALRRAVGKAQSSPTALRLGWGRTYRESLWKSLGGGLRRGPRATAAWIEDGTQCRGYEGEWLCTPGSPGYRSTLRRVRDGGRVRRTGGGSGTQEPWQYWLLPPRGTPSPFTIAYCTKLGLPKGRQLEGEEHGERRRGTSGVARRGRGLGRRDWILEKERAADTGKRDKDREGEGEKNIPKEGLGGRRKDWDCSQVSDFLETSVGCAWGPGTKRQRERSRNSPVLAHRDGVIYTVNVVFV